MAFSLWMKSSEKEGLTKSEIIEIYLSRSGRATTQEIADCLGCSANTARKWLYRMAKDGRVEWKNHYYNKGVYLMRWFLLSLVK